VVRRGRRAAALSIAAKIGADDPEVTCQQRRNIAPHEVRQQQQSWAGAGGADENRRRTRIDLVRRELIEHCYTDR
jgi:hypothetical protein